MQKDFDKWNELKKTINAKERLRFCHEREIWWCALGVNVGYEQDGVGENFERPVVVLRKFNESIFWGAALTGREKEGEYYFPIGLIANRKASVILSQIKLIDTKRLLNKIATLDEKTFENLKNALGRTFFK